MAGNAYWDSYGQATNAFAVGQQTAQRQREAAIADQQRQTDLAAGNAFAGGDYTGAANAYARGGDVGNAGKVLDWQAAQAKAQRDQQLAAAQQQADVTLKGLRALRTAPPDQRGALFASSIAPILRQRGIPQEGIDHIASIAGNDAALDAEATALGQAQAKWTHNVVNGSLVASNDQQAAAQEVFRGQRPPKYVNVPAGGQATMVDPGTPGGVVGPGGALQGQEAPPAPVVTPAPPVPSAGPISYAPPVQGMRVPAGGGFGAPRDGHVHHGEDFAVPIGTPVAASAEGVVTPFTGQRGDYGNVVEVRHPDGSVTRYAHLGQINVQPGQAVRQGDVLGASGQSGNATGPTLHFEIRQRGQAVNPAPALAGQSYQVAQNGPPRTIQGPPRAPKERPTPSGYQWDASGQRLQPIPGGPADTAPPAGPASATTGDAFLSSLPQGEQTQVKALAEGRLQFPSGAALKTPYWQHILQSVGQYDPTFDQANPRSRAQTRVDFTSGKSAQNITALNTVIGHLDDLDHAISGLNNTGFPLNNTIAHGIAQATGTDARIRNFETAKTAVANELTRVFRGTGGAEADIQAWQKQLDASSSPDALRSVVHAMAELINSRLEALGEQYRQGMGVSRDPIQLLTPDKARAFARMHDGIPPEQAGTIGQGFKVLRVH